MTYKTRFFVAVSVAIFVFLVFLPALGNDFINWDDDKNVYENSHVKNLNGAFFRWAFVGFSGYKSDYWMPLSYLSHAIVYAISGMDPMGHHFANNIIHSLNSFILVLLALMLIQVSQKNNMPEGQGYGRFAIVAAGATGLLFGIHPLRVESVVWISERKDILSAFFYLLTLISYLKYAISEKRDGTGRDLLNGRYVLTVVLFICSLASKPMAVSLPFVLLILDWYPLGRMEYLKNIKTLLIEKLPFFVLSAVSSFITMLAQSDAVAVKSVEFVPLTVRLTVVSKTLIDYLTNMVAPINLVPWHSYPSGADVFSARYGLPVVLVTSITALCIWGARRQRPSLAVWVYFMATLMPVLGLLVSIPVTIADRYSYIPGMGVSFIAGLGVATVYEKSAGVIRSKTVLITASWVISMAVLSILSYATIRQIAIWKNSIVFWNYVIEKVPDRLYFPHYNLGLAHMKQGDVNRAMDEYIKTLNIKPDYADARNNLGQAYMTKGDFDKAIDEYHYALRINPVHPDAHYNLGIVYTLQGMTDKAIDEYMTALRINPNDAEAYQNLNMLYMNKREKN